MTILIINILKQCRINIVEDQDRIFSDEDFSELYEQLQRDHIKDKAYMPSYAVELAMLTGMRCGELAGLRWSKINKKNHTIKVDTSEKLNKETRECYIDTTKTRKMRYVPMSLETEELLDRIRKVQIQNGFADEFVFTGENGRTHVSAISLCVRRKCKQAGIEIKGMNAIRRTVNSRLKCLEVSSTVAASMLGHTAEVNENNYSYDTSDRQFKLELFNKLNSRIKKLS